MKIQEPFDIFPLSSFLFLSIFINNTWSRTEQNTKHAIKSPSAGAAFEEGFQASLPGGGDATAKPQLAQTLMGEQDLLQGLILLQLPPQPMHSPGCPHQRQDWTRV